MKRLANRFHPIVYLDVSIDGAPRGRVALELFETKLPVTSRNFRAIANGFNAKRIRTLSLPSREEWNTLPLSYRNTKIHRIVPGFMIQGGDVLYNNGFGTTSIYGKTFVDEAFVVRHDRPGILSMANAGPDTNGSQFFITTAPASHLDGRHVAFGQVVCGYDIVKEIEALGSPNGRPRGEVWITDAGELNEEGYLMEVRYERARLEEKIQEEKAIDLEELRIYNECQRNGIEYVPRAVRERYKMEQAQAEKQRDADSFSMQLVKEALSMDVEDLTRKMNDTISQDILEATSSAPQTQEEIPVAGPSIASKANKRRRTLTKELLEAIKLSKNGSKTLVEALHEARRDAGANPRSELARFAEKLLEKVPNTLMTYMGQINDLLGHSKRTPAPLTAKLILQRLNIMRNNAKQQLKLQMVQESVDGAPTEMTESEEAKMLQEQRDAELLSVLKLIEKRPHLHQYSPQLNSQQISMLNDLIVELQALKSFDAPPEEIPVVATDAAPGLTLQQQIESLSAKKQSIVSLLSPWNATAPPSMPSSSSDTVRVKKPAKRKIIKE